MRESLDFSKLDKAVSRLKRAQARLPRVLVADCPWRFKDKLPGKKRGAERHYKTLTIAELCRFPLPEMHRDSYLFFWVVGALQVEALEVIESWGFEPVAELIWHKLTRKGKPWFGMGRTVRYSHERCIIARRGRPKPLRRDIRSVFEAKVPSVRSGRSGKLTYVHSAKPDEFYRLVERLVRGPRVELFARRQRGRGWTCYGNQLAGGRAHP